MQSHSVKRNWFILALLAFMLVAPSSPTVVKLVRLTVVNKAGLDIEIRLTSAMDEEFGYYLRVPEGERDFPTEKVFTVIQDIYKMNVYYMELWDPVYGYDCGGSSSETVDITRNVRIVVHECTYTPPNAGEPSMLKYGGSPCRPRRR